MFHGWPSDKGNKALQNALAVNDRLPFAAAGAVAVETRAGELLRSQYEVLLLAQMQHRLDRRRHIRCFLEGHHMLRSIMRGEAVNS